jgi:hypothetical protein
VTGERGKVAQARNCTREISPKDCSLLVCLPSSPAPFFFHSPPRPTTTTTTTQHTPLPSPLSLLPSQEVLARVETQLRLYTGEVHQLQEAAERNVMLLSQVLPQHVLSSLERGNRILVEKFPEV